MRAADRSRPGSSAARPAAPASQRPFAPAPAPFSLRPAAGREQTALQRRVVPIRGDLPPASLPAQPPVDEAGYARLAADVRALLGMDLTQYKAAQVWRRVNSFATGRGFAGADDLLAAARADAGLRDAFRDMLTINVSEFFRNPEVWDALAANYLPAILRPGQPARIWSAGCSIGFEPYTIGMLAREGFAQAGYRMLATDLDVVALAQAQAGRYREDQMAGLSEARRTRFFRQAPDGRFEVGPELKAPVAFRRHDLLADRYETGFDLVVCRNVVIYFTEDAKREIFARFAASLRPGGTLLIGATESINQARSSGLIAHGAGFYEKAGA